MTTPVLGLTELEAAQSQPEVPINAALRILEAIGQLRALDIVTEPPASPDDGDRYIVMEPSTGDFAGHETEYALRVGTAWVFLQPAAGWLCWVDAYDSHVIYRTSGSPPGWALFP